MTYEEGAEGLRTHLVTKELLPLRDELFEARDAFNKRKKELDDDPILEDLCGKHYRLYLKYAEAWTSTFFNDAAYGCTSCRVSPDHSQELSKLEAEFRRIVMYPLWRKDKTVMYDPQKHPEITTYVQTLKQLIELYTKEKHHAK